MHRQEQDNCSDFQQSWAKCRNLSISRFLDIVRPTAPKDRPPIRPVICKPTAFPSRFDGAHSPHVDVAGLEQISIVSYPRRCCRYVTSSSRRCSSRHLQLAASGHTPLCPVCDLWILFAVVCVVAAAWAFVFLFACSVVLYIIYIKRRT